MTKTSVLAAGAAVLCLPLVVLSVYIAVSEASTPDYPDAYIGNVGYLVAAILAVPVALTGLLAGIGWAVRRRAPRAAFGLVIAGLMVAVLAVLAVAWVYAEWGL